MISKKKVGRMIKETNICDVCGKEHTFDEANRLYTPEQAGPKWFDVDATLGSRESLPTMNTCSLKCAEDAMSRQSKSALEHLSTEILKEIHKVTVQVVVRRLPSK